MNSHRETLSFNDLVSEVGFDEKLEEANFVCLVQLLLLSALSNTSSTTFRYLCILSSEMHEPFSIRYEKLWIPFIKNNSTSHSSDLEFSPPFDIRLVNNKNFSY